MANPTNRKQPSGTMSSGAAVMGFLIAFLGGLLIGHLTGRSAGGGEELAIGNAAEGAGAGAAAPAEGDVTRLRVDVTNQMPQQGPADALVTIVLFSDFQCPFCSRVNPTMEQIRTEYGNRVRFVWRDNPLPFHDNAKPAAEAAREVFAQGGSEKFWAYHALLFQNQTSLDRPTLERLAQQVGGINMDRFRRALDSHTHVAAIDADVAAAAQIGARGTPAFHINGRQLMGAQPFPSFKTVIDDEIQRSQALIAARHIRPAALYATLMQSARTSPAPEPAAAAQPQAQPQPDPNAVYNVPVGTSPTKGPADALVTLVIVSDYQCPFCSRVEATYNQIAERYGRDVRFVWKDNPLPFHDNAKPAAEAAREVFAQGGAAKFWQYHDLLFQNQQTLARADLERFAEQVGGINMGRFRTALDNHTHQAGIDADMQLASSRGARGTPATFINGRFLSGAQPFEAFQRVIDEELGKARTRVEQGTARARLYETIIANAATSPQMLPGAAAPAAPSEPAEDPNRVYNIPVPANPIAKGPANARVTIQIFSDYQCPFCSRVEPTLHQLEERYGNRVRFIWRDYPLPFHQNAMPAAQAGREVFAQGGAAKFWQYHDLLFQNQQTLARADLERFAEQVGGINMTRFRAALDNNTHQAAVQADMNAVQTAGAQIGTPSFFINGRLLQGAQPIEQFTQAIDRALGQ